MRVLVTGSSGLIGSEAVEHSIGRGTKFTGSTTTGVSSSFGLSKPSLETRGRVIRTIWEADVKTARRCSNRSPPLRPSARKKLLWHYADQNRRGDHICYISNLRKLAAHYPDSTITRKLEDIIEEMVSAEQDRL